MNQQEIIEAIEARAGKLGVTIKEVCESAGVHPTTFSRWKHSSKRQIKARSAHLDRLEAITAELSRREAAQGASG